MGVGNLSEQVSVDVVFERFPASIRGAVVVRGADRDPHQIASASATVIELRAPKRPVREVGVDPVVVDLAPRGEVLLPFELPFAGLDPGWYAVAAEVVVDGQRRAHGPAELGRRRFVVGWPPASMRRGALEVDAQLGGAAIERLELKADRCVLRWREAGPGSEEAPDPVLVVGERPVPLLESARTAAGVRTSTHYPIPKGDPGASVRIEHAGASLELPLP